MQEVLRTLFDYTFVQKRNLSFKGMTIAIGAAHRRSLCCLTLCLFASSSFSETPVQEAEAALRNALDAVGQLQQGGWGRAYTLDRSIMWGEYLPIDPDWITVQPPATPTVATTFLRAGQVLKEQRYTACAQQAKEALLQVQTKAGGFPYQSDPKDGPATRATLDDNTTSAALDFLLAWWRHTGLEEDRKAVLRVGDFYITAQFKESGGWPQRYPLAGKGYGDYITFNDNVMSTSLRALMKIYEATGERRFLDAAKKGGEAIINLQGGPGEAIWAQQYDPATLKPAWARKFEPPGYTPAESSAVCDVLIELATLTGEESFLAPLPKAFEWYETHRLENGKWARLYEPGTQRPVYGRRDKAEKVYDVKRACEGYSWQGTWYPHAAKKAWEEIQEKGFQVWRTQMREANASPTSPPALSTHTLRAVRDSVETLDEKGYWTRKPSRKELEQYTKYKVDSTVPMVHMSEFNTRATQLLDYLDHMKD